MDLIIHDEDAGREMEQRIRHGLHLLQRLRVEAIILGRAQLNAIGCVSAY